MAVNLVRKLWTVDEYEEMIEKGILDKYDHVELIRGEIIEKMPIGVRHAGCVTDLEALFRHLLDDETVTIYGQNPVQMLDDSEPEPDVALLRGHRKIYRQRRPTARDVILLVEVSDSTLATDRRVKIPMYAEAGITDVWLVNLDKDVVEVYSEPVGSKYKKMALVRRGKVLTLPGGLPGSISVDEVLG